MNIIDLHCDALMKLRDGKGSLSFANAEELNTNKERLIKGKVKVQCFAIFLDRPFHPIKSFKRHSNKLTISMEKY